MPAICVWVPPVPSVTTSWNISGVYSYTPPSWWRNGVDYLDLICLGAGGAGGAYSFFTAGGGGQPGSWSGATIQSIASASLSVIVGTGGSPQYGGAGTSGSGSAVEDGSTYDTIGGGGGGGAAAAGLSASVGGSPGNYTYKGVLYIGGAAQTTNQSNGYAPGGGGSGPAASSYNGGYGAAGAVWIVARRG